MNENCAYCMEGELVNMFGIKIGELESSKVYLFREQSHKGRVIVAHKKHVSEITDLTKEERALYMEDIAKVADAMHKIFHPDKVNYGAYGDTGSHLHFHLVPVDCHRRNQSKNGQAPGERDGETDGARAVSPSASCALPCCNVRDGPGGAG